MKRLVLHLGMAKTGTSSIQDTLGASHVELRKQGVIYPPRKPYNHSYQFSVLFMDRPENSLYHKQLSPISEDAWQRELERLREQWRSLFQSFSGGTCIVSAENLPRLSTEEIQRLWQFVEPFFDEIVAVAYIRHPLTAIKSQWEQDVKELSQPLSGEDLLRRTKQRISYRFLQRWSTVLGRENVLVRPFDRNAFRNGNLLDDFLHCAGVDTCLDSDIKEAQSNHSLGPDGTAFLLAFNSRYPQYSEGKYNPERGLASRLHLFYGAMRQASSERLGMKICFDQTEAETLNEKIRYVNEFLAEGDRFPQVEASVEKTRLPDPASVNPDYYVRLVNELAHLVDQFAEHSERAGDDGHKSSAVLQRLKTWWKSF